MMKQPMVWMGLAGIVWTCVSGAGAAVPARYIRYEAPLSLQLHASEVEVWVAGANIMSEHRDGLFIIWDDTGKTPLKHYFGTGKINRDKDSGFAQLLTDAAVQERPVQIVASSYFWNQKKYPQPVLNPVLEIDLGQELEVEKVVVKTPPYTREYEDKYWRTIVVMDAAVSQTVGLHERSLGVSLTRANLCAGGR